MRHFPTVRPNVKIITIIRIGILEEDLCLMVTAR